MTLIDIHDLKNSKELNQEAMKIVSGGSSMPVEDPTIAPTGGLIGPFYPVWGVPDWSEWVPKYDNPMDPINYGPM